MKKNSTLFCAWEIPLPIRCMSALVLFAWCSASAQVQLVKDINTAADPYYSEFGITRDVNGRLFFYADGGLYISDGTPEGIQKIYDFTEIRTGVAYNNEFLFGGNDGSGFALWKSDGTTAGTVKIKQVVPYFDWDYEVRQGNYTLVGSTLFFTGSTASSGAELWKTDGTAAGTVMVKDIKPGSTSSTPFELTAVGNTLFFGAPSGNNKGVELWRSDGTAAGTFVVRDIYPGSNSSDPKALTEMNGKLYFVAKDGVNGKELWQSDGTTEGTFLLKDIRAGYQDGQVNKLITVNGTLFFEAHDGIHGKELWKSDGTFEGTVLLKDITPGPGSSAGFAVNHIDNMFSHNGLLIFTACQKGNRLWRSDGTETGTFPLTTSDALDFSFIEPDMKVFNNQLYFLAQKDWDLTQLWKTDGTIGGTQLINPALSNFDYGTLSKIEPSGSILYLLGSEPNPSQTITATALLISDGTLAGTQQIFDLVNYTIGSYPRSVTTVGDHVYFSAILDERTYHRDLWKTDGTEAGTERVAEFEYIEGILDFDGKLIFEGTKDYYGDGWGLWTSDGTDAGTVPLKSGSPGFDISYPNSFARLGDELIFGANDNSGTGRELWKTDGTPAGTVLVKDINTGYDQHSGASHMITLNSQVIFTAFTPAEGNELWKTDGTASGTVLVKDIRPSTGYSNPTDFTLSGDELFFSADDGAGIELWKTDGTTAGTVRVSDISTGNANIRFITPFADKVLFTALNSSGTNGLWVTTGVPGETTLLRNFIPGNNALIWAAGKNDQYTFWLVTEGGGTYSAPTSIWRSDGTPEGTIEILNVGRYTPYSYRNTTIDNIVYFENDYYPSMWRTDGTTCGTYPVAANFDIDELAVLNGRLFFYAEEYSETSYSIYGAELFSYTPEAAAPCMAEARVAQTATQETVTESEEGSEFVSTYPNPSRNQFTLSIPGKEDERFDIEVLTMNGKKVETHRELSYNKAYQIGAQWGSGMYIMKAFVGGKMVTRKLIKID